MNNTNNKRTTQIQTNVEECGPCPVFASFTLAFALQLRKKHDDNEKENWRILTNKEIYAWMESVQATMTTRDLEPDQWRNREEWRLVFGRQRQLLKIPVGQTDRQADRQTDGWMDGWMDRRTDR